MKSALLIVFAAMATQAAVPAGCQRCSPLPPTPDPSPPETESTCGDGAVDSADPFNEQFNEQCDGDGQAQCASGEACEACRCVPTCGNGRHDAGEACDPAQSPSSCAVTSACVQCVCVPAGLLEVAWGGESMRLGFDATLVDAVTARAACMQTVIDCYDATGALLGCIDSAPTCNTLTPWQGELGCCAAACKTQVTAAVAGGESERAALLSVLATDGRCMPGFARP